MEWISVEERLPEVAGHYIVAYQSAIEDGFYVMPCWYNGKFWQTNVYQTVTHWTPLPEPPTDLD